MLSTKFPFVLRFQLNEQQQLKAVRVSGTDMCGEEWAGGSADWYSAVVESQYLSACGVNCLQLQELDCQNSEGGGSNLQRKLIIIRRTECNDI